jgi:hypothetical protein
VERWKGEEEDVVGATIKVSDANGQTLFGMFTTKNVLKDY